jgi:hypothetical protein
MSDGEMKIHPKKDVAALGALASKRNSWYENDVEAEENPCEEDDDYESDGSHDSDPSEDAEAAEESEDAEESEGSDASDSSDESEHNAPVLPAKPVLAIPMMPTRPTPSFPPFPSSMSSSSAAMPPAKKQRVEDGGARNNDFITATALLNTLVPSIVLGIGQDREMIEKIINFADDLGTCAREHLASMIMINTTTSSSNDE